MLFLQVCEKHFRTLRPTYFRLKNKGDHSVIYSRLFIITITTRTHNSFRLVRPRKMSSGSVKSVLFSRYLIGNEKKYVKKIDNWIYCIQNCALDHLSLFQITGSLVPIIRKGTQYLNGFLQLFLETIQRPQLVMVTLER